MLCLMDIVCAVRWKMLKSNLISWLKKVASLISEMGGKGGGGVDVYLPDYILGKPIGVDSSDKMKIAEHKLTGLIVIIKRLNRQKIKDRKMEEKVRRELNFLGSFMHPNIIRVYEVVETPSDTYVVMEHVKSGEVFDYIVEKGRLEEGEAWNFFQQIISGVEYCHRNMAVHRDLKPQNLLLDSHHNVKIANFGLSNIMRDGHFLKTSCGSPNYASPEVISGKLYAGPEVDVWSCGLTLFALLCGFLPFDDENAPNLLKKIKAGTYTLPSHLSPGARDLISRMLVVDPMKRITIPEIGQHTWFQAHFPCYLAVLPPDTMQLAKKVNDLIGMHPNEVASPAAGHQNLGCVDNQRIGSQQQFLVERKWALGLQSLAHPHEIMTEAQRVLQELNVCWKKIGHYNMKCRWIPGHHEVMINNHVHNHFDEESSIVENDGALRSPNVVKFEVQLYKTGEKYILDLQWVQGPQILFLDLSAAFLAQFGVL